MSIQLKVKEVSFQYSSAFKRYSAVISGSLFVFCVILAGISADNYYADFNIDYYSIADLEDYLLLGIRKLMAGLPSLCFYLFLVLMSLLILLGLDGIGGDYDDDYMNPERSINLGCLKEGKIKKLLNSHIVIIFILILSGAFITLAIGDKGMDVNRIVNGKTELKSVIYGKGGNQVDCLSYIGSVGGFMHYWSIKSKGVVSVNKSIVFLIKKQFESAPYPPSRPKKRFLGGAEFTVKEQELRVNEYNIKIENRNKSILLKCS